MAGIFIIWNAKIYFFEGWTIFMEPLDKIDDVIFETINGI